MKKGMILFSGVHGVGKGYLISKNVKDVDNIVCFGASALIQQYQNSEDAGYKKVKNVLGNQEILLAALHNVDMSTDKILLLDGHLCIINSNNEIERIPEAFILQAETKGIIILQEKTSLIAQRQQSRDGKGLSTEMINRIQCEEKAFAELLLEKYKIPFKIISGEYGRDDFLRIINEMKEGD